MGDYFGHRGGGANFKNPGGVIVGILKASRMNSATTANIPPFPLCISARLACPSYKRAAASLKLPRPRLRSAPCTRDFKRGIKCPRLIQKSEAALSTTELLLKIATNSRFNERN